MNDDWDAASFVIRSKYRKEILGELERQPATPSTIAENLGHDIAQVSRALGELREEGMVDLLVSEEQRKGRVYGITDRGREIWALLEDNDLA